MVMLAVLSVDVVGCVQERRTAGEEGLSLRTCHLGKSLSESDRFTTGYEANERNSDESQRRRRRREKWDCSCCLEVSVQT